MINSVQSMAFVPVDYLRFDPHNPRLPTTVDGHNEQAVIDWMLTDATIIELMGSIGERGYFPGEPLLVVPIEGSKDFYEVVEGNRRLTAVKLLLDPTLASVRRIAVQAASDTAAVKPDSLPVMIFDRRNDIINYLGYRHITGIKEWSSIAKAKYLKQLLVTVPGRSLEDKYKVLARIIGSRADYVARLLAGLAVHDQILENAFFGIKGLNEDSVSFSVLTTALNYANIAEFLGLESGRDATLKGLKPNNLKELTSLLFERNSEGKTRIGESRNLRQFNAVVASDRALKSFRSGATLSAAYVLTDEPLGVFHSTLLEARERLQTAQSHIHLVNKPTLSDEELLKEIQAIVRDLRLLLSQRRIEQEDE